MIRYLSYEDIRLRHIEGDPLISTMIEAAARQCGMGLLYDFWAVFPNRRSRTAQGFILRKGHAIWATVCAPEAAPEMIDFLRFHQTGWMELDPTLAALWGDEGETLCVLRLPEEAPLPPCSLPLRENCATAVADCNLAAGALRPEQYEAAVVALHLAQRRRVGYTVSLWEEGRAVSAAAVTDRGHRAGQISYVATLPSHEGKGYGRAMVFRCAAELRAAGLLPLVACEADRRSFYEELGFLFLDTTHLFAEPDPFDTGSDP